ncbi:MAG: glycoside hydrolase family 9 protein [Fibromonadales bacterium]|nr:glycoside hydrolase family 9 protein [Fibromonadales bacterium]
MNQFLFLLLLATLCFSQNLSDFIVIDQFGYRTNAQKVAVIRNPKEGIDANQSFSPGTVYRVINEGTYATAFEGNLEHKFTLDPDSGDEIWWFDFSSVNLPGRYYVLDVSNNVRSFSFSIANDVYNNALKAAVKMFYYQRAGTNKPKEYAGETWADGFNFLQDAQSRDFFDSTNVEKERDLTGGWFDAGDYNKYTKWTADYVESLLMSYEENPAAFADDYGIPESGNGTPDILDEVKWGISWLLKMQNEDGSVLSVQSLAHKDASPPSSAAGRSYYGPANTTATLGTAKAFAVASRIFGARGETAYAEQLKESALKAWDWAEAYPDSIFHNNSEEQGSVGLAAGNQELSDSWDRVENRINAAFSLYELTGENSFLDIFENNLSPLPLYAWSDFMDQYRFAQHMLYMRYLEHSGGTASVKSTMRNKLVTAFAKSGDFYSAHGSDGYRSFIKAYNWGSNKAKADYGITFFKWNIVSSSANYKDIAEDYLHYIHGVNPFNMVYLTSMQSYGAAKSLSAMYHEWFGEGGNIPPVPGYLAGGPNENYGLDGCCPSSCGSASNNARCNLATIPNKNTEPPAKMYKDINYSWPMNSWEITEPHNGYQVSYIRLLSKFVENGGNVPVKKQNNVQNFNVVQDKNSLQIFGDKSLQVSIYSPNGKLLLKEQGNGTVNINLQKFPNGIYILRISSGSIKENRIIAK